VCYGAKPTPYLSLPHGGMLLLSCPVLTIQSTPQNFNNVSVILACMDDIAVLQLDLYDVTDVQYYAYSKCPCQSDEFNCQSNSMVV